MTTDRQREIASKGGRAAHKKGTAHEFSQDEAREAGRKGGQAISRNREHMARIGREGGRAAHAKRATEGTESADGVQPATSGQAAAQQP